MSVDTVNSLKARRNGIGARPNVYKRSLEARKPPIASCWQQRGWMSRLKCRGIAGSKCMSSV